MKSVEMAWSLALLMTVVLICWISYACYRFVETTIASIPFQVFITLGIVCCASFGLIVSGTAIFVVRWLFFRSNQIYAKNGLYPHVYDGCGYINLNESGAQRIAALSGCKPSASVVSKIAESWQQVGNEDPALIPGPAAAPAPLSVSDVMAFDPKISPHWFFVGCTGSGKTCASYQILSEFSRLHGCEFVICEPGGVNWGEQAKATKTAEIADVIIEVHEEMLRRQELLRQHDVSHVSELPEPLPCLVLVSEETDSVFDDLKLSDRTLRTHAMIALRGIARMGRKAGVCLVAVSTSGTADVFDSTVRKNLSNVFLFRNEHTVAESWRIGRKLNRLPVGMAYSVAHEDVVQFDCVNRPQLVSGWSPKSAWSGASGAPVVPISGGSSPVVQRLARGCEPDAATAEQLRTLYRAGRSKNSLCYDFWGGKDGQILKMLNRVLGADQMGHSIARQG